MASNSPSSLHDQLDDLWIRYLTFLDEYTTAQATIKKTMSAGFFSLAQANFKTSGRRFGQDSYDQRALATSRVRFDGETMRVEHPTPESDVPGTAEKDELEPAEKEAPTHLPSPSPTPEPEDRHDSKEFTPTDADAPKKAAIDIHDPIRWFGILIPPALRSAQKSFTSAVRDENGISQAVNAAKGMRESATQIRKLQKAMRAAEKNSASAIAAI